MALVKHAAIATGAAQHNDAHLKAGQVLL